MHPKKVIQKFAVMPIFYGGITGMNESWAMCGTGFARSLAKEWLEGEIGSWPASWMDDLNGGLDKEDGKIGNLVLYCAQKVFMWKKCPQCQSAI